MWLTTWYVATFEMAFFAWDKIRLRATKLYIIHCIFGEQWESNSALKVDKLVNSLLRKWPLNVLVSSEELFFVHPSRFALGTFRVNT